MPAARMVSLVRDAVHPWTWVGNRVRLEDALGVLIALGNPLPVTSAGSTAWTPEVDKDETLNDNDKTFTIPANEVWHVEFIRVDYTAQGTGTVRQLEVEFIDPDADVIFSLVPSITQTLGEEIHYNFGPSMGDLDALRDTTWFSMPMPPTSVFGAGWQIRVYDNNNIDANDDMLVYVTHGTRAA